MLIPSTTEGLARKIVLGYGVVLFVRSLLHMLLWLYVLLGDVATYTKIAFRMFPLQTLGIWSVGHYFAFSADVAPVMLMWAQIVGLVLWCGMLIYHLKQKHNVWMFSFAKFDRPFFKRVFFGIGNARVTCQTS